MFVNKLFTKKTFEQDFVLVSNVEGKNLTMPEGIRREQFVQWTDGLPDTQSPVWMGLPSNAEKVLLTTQGRSYSHAMLIFSFAVKYCNVRFPGRVIARLSEVVQIHIWYN